jgi:hypothetical protein
MGAGGNTLKAWLSVVMWLICRHVAMNASLLDNEWDWDKGSQRYDNAMHFF